MQQLYFFLILSLFLCSQSLLGQFVSKQHLTLGLSQNEVHLNAAGSYLVYGTFANSRHSFSGARGAESIGVSAGYTLQFLPRFEASVRANYTGNRSEELIMRTRGENANGERFDHTFMRVREYRAVWAEALLFWRVIGPRSRADVQLGIGVTYLGYTQNYRSGFEFDVDRGIYNVQAFVDERRGRLGLPLHAQMQFPIANRVKLGLDGFINFYGDDKTITGLTLIGAYQLGN